MLAPCSPYCDTKKRRKVCACVAGILWSYATKNMSVRYRRYFHEMHKQSLAVPVLEDAFASHWIPTLCEITVKGQWHPALRRRQASRPTRRYIHIDAGVGDCFHTESDLFLCVCPSKWKKNPLCQYVLASAGEQMCKLVSVCVCMCVYAMPRCFS